MESHSSSFTELSREAGETDCHCFGIVSSIMAGIGEVSAILGLIATATRLSKAVIDIGNTYKEARLQIASFGREVGILGKILDQLNRLLLKDENHMDESAKTLAREIVDECIALFAQLDVFNDKLYGYAESADTTMTLRGKAKWVFEAAQLEYLKTRVDSMKINILLMMMLQSAPHRDR